MTKRRNVLTTGEVAQICQVAPRTVSKWFDQGMIEGYKIPGSKDRRMLRESVVAFMQKNKIPINFMFQDDPKDLIDRGNGIVVIDDGDDADVLKSVLSDNGLDIRMLGCAFEAGGSIKSRKPRAIIINVSKQSPSVIASIRKSGFDQAIIATGKDFTKDELKSLIDLGATCVVDRSTGMAKLATCIMLVIQ